MIRKFIELNQKISIFKDISYEKYVWIFWIVVIISFGVMALEIITLHINDKEIEAMNFSLDSEELDEEG